MFKIACLILAHKNASQIKRLSDTLTRNGLFVFIHLDRKWTLTPDDKELFASFSSNAYIIDERISTFLDHRSLVDASLALIREAKRVLNPNYYILMSAQDYPIKPIPELKDMLYRKYPNPFIDCTPYDKRNWIYYKFKDSGLYNDFLHTLRQSRCCFIRKVERRLHKFHLGNTRFSLHRKLQESGVALYGGSAWWTLPDIVINEILSDINLNKYLYNLNLKSYTPEETFFQTYTMRTSLKTKVSVNDRTEQAQNCLTYANFETPTKPFCGHPHIIESEDWKWLVARREFFARKFDMEKDKKVFDVIDKFIGNF